MGEGKEAALTVFEPGVPDRFIIKEYISYSKKKKKGREEYQRDTRYREVDKETENMFGIGRKGIEKKGNSSEQLRVKT